MPELELPDISETMVAAYDAAENGTDFVPPEKQPDTQAEQVTDQGDEQVVEQPADAPAPLEPPARWSADDKEASRARSSRHERKTSYARPTLSWRLEESG